LLDLDIENITSIITMLKF